MNGWLALFLLTSRKSKSLVSQIHWNEIVVLKQVSTQHFWRTVNSTQLFSSAVGRRGRTKPNWFSYLASSVWVQENASGRTENPGLPTKSPFWTLACELEARSIIITTSSPTATESKRTNGPLGLRLVRCRALPKDAKHLFIRFSIIRVKKGR